MKNFSIIKLLIVGVAGISTSYGASVVYMGSLNPTYMKNGWGPMEVNQSNGEQAAKDGKPISINGTACTQGLGMHAPADIRYSVKGMAAALLRGAYGIDDSVRPNGSVDFRIYADGVEKYRGGVMNGKSVLGKFSIDIRGASEIRFVVSPGTTKNYAWFSLCNVNVVSHSNVLQPDVAAPIISAPKVVNITSNSASVSWQTDEMSFSRVDYGLATPLTISSYYPTSLSRSFSVSLPNLSPNKNYFYKIVSRDPYGHVSSSPVLQFKTLAEPVVISQNGLPPATCPTTVTTTVNVGQSIQAAFNSANPGSVIKIKNGTYSESLNLTRSGTVSAPITICAETPSKVTVLGGAIGSGQYISLKGIIFHGSGGFIAPGQNEQALVRTNSGWIVNGVTVENAPGTGMGVFGNNVQVLNSIFRNNATNGLGGGKPTHVMVDHVEVYNNNTRKQDPGNEGGGGKWAASDSVTIQNSKYHDNYGPGIWFDISNTNMKILNNELYNHTSYIGLGVIIEISWNGLIQGNYFHGNVNGGGGYTTNAGVGIGESQNIEIKNNTFLSSVISVRNCCTRKPSANITQSGNVFK